MTKLEQVQLIKITDIDTSDRLRPIDTVWAEAIAASIAKSGLNSPIDICKIPTQSSGKPYKLVFGGHRVAAYEILGLEEIPAFIRDHDSLKRRGREIAENLFRADLKPYERANFISQMVEIEKGDNELLKVENILSLAASKRWNREGKSLSEDASAMIAQAFKINERVAEKLGLSRRTIYNDLTFLRIPKSQIERLQAINSPILENASQLKSFAKMPPERADSMLADLEKGVDIKSAFNKHRDLKPEIITETQAQEQKFLKDFDKLPSHVQDAVVAGIAMRVANRWSIERRK